MPFDGTARSYTQDTQWPAKAACLLELSHLLRDRSQWPAGFRWDYRFHETCAIGLGNLMFGACSCPSMVLPDDLLVMIFLCGAWSGKPIHKVTPNDVADALDAYLERRMTALIASKQRG